MKSTFSGCIHLSEINLGELTPSKLISDKNEIIKEGGGRNNLLNEKEQNQFIKIKKRKKDVIANEIEDKKEDLDERQKNSKKINSKNKNELRKIKLKHRID